LSIIIQAIINFFAARKLIERERQLEDELEEYKERVSELQVDIDLLTSSLHKAQTTITVLKVSFLLFQCNFLHLARFYLVLSCYRRNITNMLFSFNKMFLQHSMGLWLSYY